MDPHIGMNFLMGKEGEEEEEKKEVEWEGVEEEGGGWGYHGD